MAMLLVAVLFALAWVGPITAYIPAVPVNGSNAVQADARLSINWDPNGVFGNMVSFQLAKNDSDGFAEVGCLHKRPTVVSPILGCSGSFLRGGFNERYE